MWKIEFIRILKLALVSNEGRLGTSGDSERILSSPPLEILLGKSVFVSVTFLCLRLDLM